MQRLRLSFVRTAFESVYHIRHHGRAVVGLLLPVAVLTALSDIQFTRAGADGEYQTGELGSLAVLVTAWLYLTTCVTLGLYRLFLSDRLEPQPASVYRWTSTHWRLLGWGLLLGVLTGLTAAIPLVTAGYITSSMGEEDMSATGQLLQAAAMVVGYYFYGRWVFALPMILLPGMRPDLGNAWELSRGNALHMLLCVGLLPTVHAVLFIPLPDVVWVSVVGALLTALVMVAEIAMVSRAMVRQMDAGVTAELEDE